MITIMIVKVFCSLGLNTHIHKRGVIVGAAKCGLHVCVCIGAELFKRCPLRGHKLNTVQIKHRLKKKENQRQTLNFVNYLFVFFTCLEAPCRLAFVN